MDYVVENWVKDNRVAIESSLRNQIAEEFIDGLKTLFNEHYIDVPEDKIDIINDLTNMNTILEHKLNDMILENTKLQKSSVEDEMESIFEEVSTGLVETQKEKLAALSEGIEFDNLEVYARKLQTIKEHYFARKSSASNIDNETFELNEEKAPSSYPDVNRYVDAITRTVKHQ
jgi:nucleoid DNA-binding protein